MGHTRPPFSFGATEGRWWPFVDETSLLLAFEASEEVVAAVAVVVDKNKTKNPPTRVWSE